MTTHADLVRAGFKFCMQAFNPAYIVTEPTGKGVSEQPDIFLIMPHTGVTMIVECKVSREDSMADLHKPFREKPHLGLGMYRVLLHPHDIDVVIPKGWDSWVYTLDGRIIGDTDLSVLTKHRNSHRNEMLLMASLARNAKFSGMDDESRRAKNARRFSDVHKQYIDDYLKHIQSVTAKTIVADMKDAEEFQDDVMIQRLSMMSLVNMVRDYVHVERPHGFSARLGSSPVELVRSCQ